MNSYIKINIAIFLTLGILLLSPLFFFSGASAKTTCLVTEVGTAPGKPVIPQECIASSGVCAGGGTGKEGAFQALTSGEQTLFSEWGTPRSGGRSHQGVDLGRATGTAIFSIEDGVVTKVNHTESGLGGVTVTMKSDSGRNHYFAHLVTGSNQHISQGMRITKCQQVGAVGDTGNATADPPHLHYQISNTSGIWVNPEIELAPYPNLGGAPNSDIRV